MAPAIEVPVSPRARGTASKDAAKSLRRISDTLLWLERGTLFLCKEEIARKDLLVSAQSILDDLSIPVEQQTITNLCSVFNRGALILMKAGAFSASQECVYFQIRFCCDLLDTTGHLEWIQASAQAMINLARLHAQAGRIDDAIALLSDIHSCADTVSLLRLACRLLNRDDTNAHCEKADLRDREVIENCFVTDSIKACLYSEDYSRLRSLVTRLRASVPLHDWRMSVIQEAEVHLALYDGRPDAALRSVDVIYRANKGNHPPDPSILLLAARAYRLLEKHARAEQLDSQLSSYALQLSDRGFNRIAKRIAYFLALDYARNADLPNATAMAKFAFDLSLLVCDQVTQVRSQILLSMAHGVSFRSTPKVDTHTSYAIDHLLLAVADSSSSTSNLGNFGRLISLASSVPTSIDLAALQNMYSQVSLPPLDPVLLTLYKTLTLTAEQLV